MPTPQQIPNAVSERPAPSLSARAPHVTRRAPASWLSIEAAARILGVDRHTLRNAILDHARSDADGLELAEFDGVRAHKIGRRWRVILDPSWLDNDASSIGEVAS